MQVVTTIELPENAPAALVLAHANNLDSLIAAYGKTTKAGKDLIRQQAELRKLAASIEAADNAARAEHPAADFPGEAGGPKRFASSEDRERAANIAADPTDAAEQGERQAADSPAALKAIFDSQGIPEQTLNQAAAEFHGRPLADAETKGYKVEVFSFGKTPLGIFWNNLTSEYEVYTSKGTRLSRSPKTKFHAMNGARNEIKKRQRARQFRSSPEGKALAARSNRSVA